MSTTGTGAAARYTKKDFESDQDVRWCPGCGDYAILSAVQKAMPDLGVPRENIVFISGIGSNLAFVAGPIQVYVEPERADEARELLTALPAVSLAPPEEAPGSPGGGDE